VDKLLWEKAAVCTISYFRFVARKIIPYKPELTERARYLRNNSTLSEIILWKHLKGKQMRGFDFHRQKPLLDYIVDFYCSELFFAIEIDGSSHKEKQEYDNNRQAKLEALGIAFLRFDDGEIKNDIYRVLREIEKWIDENAKDRVE